MNERIDLYVKDGRRWVYFDCTRNHATLVAAERWASQFYGQPIKARWSERAQANVKP